MLAEMGNKSFYIGNVDSLNFADIVKSTVCFASCLETIFEQGSFKRIKRRA